jgi:hypothetical protein
MEATAVRVSNPVQLHLILCSEKDGNKKYWEEILAYIFDTERAA